MLTSTVFIQDTLVLSCTPTGDTVAYMDIEIRPEGRGSRLTTVLYDKRQHEPLKSLFIIKYRRMSSNISKTAKHNTVTSQFYRFLSIILSRSNCIDSRADVIKLLIKKGYPAADLLSRLQFLCWQHPESYGILADKLYSRIRAAVQG